MWVLTFSIILVTCFYFYIKSFFKRRVKDNSKLVIKEKKLLETIFLDTLELNLKTIPLSMFKEKEGERMEMEGEFTLKDPFWIEEGKVVLYWKGKEICTKEAGDVVMYSLGMLLDTPSVKCRALRGTRVVFMRCINKYITFSYLRKKCIEVVNLYFNFMGPFIKIEEEEIKGEEPDKVNERVCKLLKINQDDDFREQIRFRVLEKNEILKKSGTVFDHFIYVHYGMLKVSVDGKAFHFEGGKFFGYFNLFFKIYKSIEILAIKKTKIQIYDYNTLKKNGFREEDIDLDLFRCLPDFVHLVDLCCDWRIYPPGTVLFKEGDTPKDFVYLLQGATKSHNSGGTVGCRECLMGESIEETVYTTKTSDVIKIPKGVVELFMQRNPSPLELAKVFYGAQEPRGGKIVVIFPVNDESNILLFTKRLKASIGRESLLMNTKDISEILSNRAFGVSEELRLVDYLNRVAQAYSAVIVHLENKYSRFLKYLLKVSDTCLITGRSPNACPERLLSLERYCDLEYVTLYEEPNKIKKDLTLGDKIEINRVHHVLSPSRTILFDTKDFERLGRFLLGRRVGLVLSGGGARGIAHIGVIQALEEEGIPIDIIWGTSMGAFIGALYARDCDNGHVFRVTKRFCDQAKRILPFLLDLTYPMCSIFSGKAINNALKGIFKGQNIQDLWLEYFCISTNLFTNDEEVHRSGLIWKYVRASMGICGYLPPVCDARGFLVDGGYLNNVPADVMLDMGVSLVIAVDVGTVYENDYDPYDEHLNGFVALLHRYFKTRKYLTMEEIQYRIAFLTTEKKMKQVENNNKVVMIRPDLQNIHTGDFKRFDEIVAQGYQSAKKTIKGWKATGVHEKIFKLKEIKKIKRRYSV